MVNLASPHCELPHPPRFSSNGIRKGRRPGGGQGAVRASSVPAQTSPRNAAMCSDLSYHSLRGTVADGVSLAAELQELCAPRFLARARSRTQAYTCLRAPVFLSLVIKLSLPSIATADYRLLPTAYGGACHPMTRNTSAI